MKSENQIIIRCKQPIKIEKPFHSLLTSPYIAGEKKYSSDRFVVIFSVFILSMPSKVIIIVIEFMFLGINIFCALLRAHFNPRLTARAKMCLSRGPKHIYAREHNSIVLLSHTSSSRNRHAKTERSQNMIKKRIRGSISLLPLAIFFFFFSFQANVLAAKEIIPGDDLFLLPTLRVD